MADEFKNVAKSSLRSSLKSSTPVKRAEDVALFGYKDIVFNIVSPS